MDLNAHGDDCKSDVPVDDRYIANALNDAARSELEQKILGLMLHGDHGALDIGCRIVRPIARNLLPPHDRIVARIFEAHDSGLTVSASIITACVANEPWFRELDQDYLRGLSDAAPSMASPSDMEQQMRKLVHTLRSRMGAQAEANTVSLIRADTVEAKNVEWIWPGWLSRNKLHLLAGSPGTGKTTIAVSFAATIASGGDFPDGLRAERGSVLIWSGEDDLSDSLLPRFMACGGDPSRLHYVEGYRDEHGDSVPFDPATDMERLSDAAAAIGDLRLLILDPVVSAVQGDSHKNTEVRRALQPLGEFAEQRGVAVLGISHFSKGTSGRDPAERITGSVAFSARPRVVMVTVKQPEAAESRRLVRAKSNIGPDGGGFEYQLVRVPLQDKPDVQGQRVAWGEPLEGSAQELLAELESPEPEFDKDTKLAVAADFLTELLKGGMVKSTHVQAEAERAGHKWATIRRAKARASVACTNIRGDWFWSLPDHLLSPTPVAHLKKDEQVRHVPQVLKPMSKLACAPSAHQFGTGHMVANPEHVVPERDVAA